MANYAYVQNGKILDVVDSLPKNWKNISNFDSIKDQNRLASLGWLPVVKEINHDPKLYRINKINHVFEDNVVYERYDVKPITIVPEDYISRTTIIEGIKARRDQLMSEFQWRYERYHREVRLGLPTTDDIELMDRYMQALADITNQNYMNVVWPEYGRD